MGRLTRSRQPTCWQKAACILYSADGALSMSESRKPVCCEIIAIGNELLIGDVQDTNTYWLIQQLTGLGGLVRRCSIVRDDIAAIAATLRASVAAQTDLVITSGGLGPTGD